MPLTSIIAHCLQFAPADGTDRDRFSKNISGGADFGAQARWRARAGGGTDERGAERNPWPPVARRIVTFDRHDFGARRAGKEHPGRPEGTTIGGAFPDAILTDWIGHDRIGAGEPGRVAKRQGLIDPGRADRPPDIGEVVVARVRRLGIVRCEIANAPRADFRVAVMHAHRD
jgi:hypothetical protein